MQLTIRLFARLREIAGHAELAREAADNATAHTLWETLCREFPDLAKYRTVVSCAVNQEYASFDTLLEDGDEVAFLPPVSGGGAARRRGKGQG